MHFRVDNLPGGLRVDPRTGQITGSVKDRGEYAVTLRAENAVGEAKRTFKIVCGDTLALTPHMGWNDCYAWDDHVSDKIVHDAADAMVSSGMINHGYMYVNIDGCWQVKPGEKDPLLDGPPRDKQGNILPNKRFPDMKALTNYIHGRGLKAGIYSSPGPLDCAGYEGSYHHEEQDARQFAAWGFDFLKYDWCTYDRVAPHPDLAGLQKPYRKMAAALKTLDRDIVFNFCQYGGGSVWQWGREAGGQSWRTAGDLGASYDLSRIAENMFRDGFGLYGRNELQKYSGPGAWNDPDYLLLGYLWTNQNTRAPTSFSPDEQYAQVSLWCLVTAPLILGGDISRLDPFTLSLLTNDEVLEVDQDPLGKAALRVTKVGDLEVWAKEMEDGRKAVGLFNLGPSQATVTAKWADLGLSGARIVRDLWRQKDLGSFDGTFSSKVGRHGVVLVSIRPASDPARHD
jgi:alpha-galactosidase